jgi:VWFA-related protein
MTRPLAAAVCTVLTLAAAGPQDRPANLEVRAGGLPPVSAKPRRDASTIRVNTDLVMIPVSVADEFDRQILGLTREQFRVFDDQVEQAITQFSSTDAPMSIGIVFDASGSMGSKLKKSREAVAEILGTANPEDEFALIQFNERVRRLVPLTANLDDILRGLAFTEAKGRTALLDAIYYAVDMMKRARHARKAIVIISDGGDNCSRYSLAETLRMVREADVQIYAIAAGVDYDSNMKYQEEVDGPELLQAVSEMTGGRMFSVRRAENLRGAAIQIGAILRNQYLLGYSPDRMEADGRYHRVQVRVQGVDRARLSWRLGYHAPLE